MNFIKKLLKFLAILLFFLSIFILIMYFWLYKSDLTAVKLQVFNNFSLPIGKIGTEKVYVKEVSFYIESGKNSAATKLSFKQALNLLIEQKKIESLAKSLNLEAKADQINWYFENFKKQENLSEKLKNLNISETQFKQIFLAPYLDKENLNIWFNEQENWHKDTYLTAKNIQAQAIDTDTFTRLAQTYSKDNSSKDLGGDLGSRSESEILYILRSHLNNLRPGQTDLVASQFGLHIIRLENKLEDKNQNMETKYHFKQIFLPLEGFEDWLKTSTQPITSNIYINLE